MASSNLKYYEALHFISLPVDSSITTPSALTIARPTKYLIRFLSDALLAVPSDIVHVNFRLNYSIYTHRILYSVLTKSKYVEIVFIDSDKHFKAVNSNPDYIMGQLLGRCVGFVSGQEWQVVRATVRNVR